MKTERESIDGYLKRIDETSIGEFEAAAENAHPTQTRPWMLSAIKEWYRKQEDIKNAPREQREVNMEKHARHSKWAAIIAAVAAVAAVAAAMISGYALFVALTSKGS